MQKKIKIFLGFSFALMCFLSMGMVSYAEDDTVCSGRVTGSTELDNPNAATMNFDAHEIVEDLSVEDGISGDGLAPGTREFAACVQKVDPFSYGGFEYVMKGWAWNTNLGFVSFYCGDDGENQGVACGGYDYTNGYGVRVGDAEDGTLNGGLWMGGALALEERNLYGYAYSDVFGWINFHCDNPPAGGSDGIGGTCGDFSYGVKRRADGTLTGYAFSEAGVYVKLDGVTMELDEPLDDGGGNWCEGKSFACVEFTPNPVSDLDLTLDDGAPLADGYDGYEMHLYLRNEDGSAEMTQAAYPVLNLDFIWEDTVKANQVDGGRVGIYDGTGAYTGTSTLDEVVDAWSTTANGATQGKLVDPIDWVNLETHFTQDPLDSSHYIYNKTIKSYGPTKGANVSFTTSLSEPTLFLNEVFLTDPGITEVAKEKNELRLERVDVDVDDGAADGIYEVEGPIYPHGKAMGVTLEYRPVVELDTLYAGTFEDVIIAFRNIPVNFTFGAKKYSSENLAMAVPFNSVIIDMILAYSAYETGAECLGDASDFKFEFLDVNGELNGVNRLRLASGIIGVTDAYQAKAVIDWCAVMGGIPGCEDDADSDHPELVPCSSARSPSFYTTIEYDSIKKIKYFSNKLPRIGGDLISNPVAVIHGNVYAQEAFTPSSEVESVQESGDIVVNVVLDTINQNVKTRLRDYVPLGGVDKATCLITNMGAYPVVKGTGCANGVQYTIVEDVIEGDRVFYFKNTDVLLEPGSTGWEADDLIIIEGGNLFINMDVYQDLENKDMLPVAVMREQGDLPGTSGNAYINPNVKNVQMTLVLDGSLFGYTGNAAEIDANGEPAWDSFDTMIYELRKQLLWQGSIASLNTIGGADLADYLLLGTGEVLTAPFTPEEQMRAQFYDLNYLRFFRLEIEMGRDGYPIDQQCGSQLTNENILAITAKARGGVSGVDYDPDDILITSLGECNGIQLELYEPGNPASGDLVAPPEEGILADGLAGTPDEYNPVVIFYVPPSDSFIFEAEGAVRID